MDKALTPSRGDRVLRVFRHVACSVRGLGLSRQLLEDEHFAGGTLTISGRQMANFGLCSYLGLGDDERLKQGAIEAIEDFGTSYSSSVAYTAVPLYKDLQEGLEQMFGAKVVLAPTTTLAHLAALPILVRPGDGLLVDSFSHASVRTATQMLQTNGVEVRLVDHNDTHQIRSALLDFDSATKVWLLIDGVYSMFGDVAPAVELHDLLNAHPNLHIYCDDAHGFGWDGLNGRGTYLRLGGWHERLVVAVGLSKSFGATGGAIATLDEDLAEFIELCGPPLTFGGPIPPAALGAGVASTKIHLSDELAERQEELKERIKLVNSLAAEVGLPLARTDETPIWFLDVGKFEDMSRLLLRMADAGFYLNPSTFPIVPRGHSGLRFTVTLYNDHHQIEEMIVKLNEARLELFGTTEIEIEPDAAAEVTARASSGGTN